MIVTRHWLNEWVEISAHTSEALVRTFNAIGLEVERTEYFRMPEKIVVGKIRSCEPHPDADKLRVCLVDIGTKTEQIVCGAANVAADQYVPVAVVGAVMPGGLAIKPVSLRGVDSAGMICSATELGLPKINDGILELDASIGELVPGRALREYPLLNDDLIEIELTANRGDCLSIRGVARDLCAALDENLKPRNYRGDDESRIGIGKLLKLEVEGDIGANVRYHAVSVDAFRVPLIIAVRLAMLEASRSNAVEALLEYAMHSTGVILRAYPVAFFQAVPDEVGMIVIRREAHGFAAVYGRECASVVGIRQEDVSRLDEPAGTIVIEASYIAPEVISKRMAETNIPSGPLYYRTSRGSEPELSLGTDFLFSGMESASQSKRYGGQLEHMYEFESKIIGLDMAYITSIIGTLIDKSRVANLLKGLGFDISKSSEEHFIVSVPRYRHDVVNRQDIVEEIVRIIGIDNIPSKPYVMTEADRLDADYFAYRKKRAYRQRAAQSGFYESVHFVFNERKQLESLGFECLDGALELLNPIAATFDTLRPTLLVGLLNAASENAKNGRKRIPLFEIGSVFDARRRERVKIALLFAGDMHDDALENAGKPNSIDFSAFVKRAADVLGDLTLRAAKLSHKLAHPYQSAAVYQEGKRIGELFSLHPSVRAALDLPPTVMFEGDFDALSYASVEARPYSKFQVSFRDLSVLVPSHVSYETLSGVIESARDSQIVRFYPVDRYTDSSLGDQVSLTVRFMLQSQDKTLEDEDITSAMQGILDALETRLGVTLR